MNISKAIITTLLFLSIVDVRIEAAVSMFSFGILQSINNRCHTINSDNALNPVDMTPISDGDRISVQCVFIVEGDKKFLEFKIEGLVKENQKLKASKKDKEVELSCDTNNFSIRTIDNNFFELTTKQEKSVARVKNIIKNIFQTQSLGALDIENADDPKIISYGSSVFEVRLRVPFAPLNPPKVTSIPYNNKVVDNIDAYISIF